MSNKAIVFYTGDLLEPQENSLREAHGIENIFFVPIENMNDLDTKILETTEQPFTVYNYLTDPDLIIALCDKLSNLTAETGFLPEYFIWVEEIKTSRREEITTETSHSKPIDLNANGGVAKQLIGRTERLPITHVMQPESFMTAGIVLSDDVMYGMLFDEVPNCFIYTSSEKNLLSWFNTLIMNLAVSKREFPLLKAVIYAFEDERNQPMLGDDRDHNFVSRHIFAALELFGDTNEIKIFKPNEIEEFKQYIALTEEEKSQRTELVAQAHLSKPLHVDVSDIPMPLSISRIKENVEKFAEMQKRKDVKALMVDYDSEAERPDPYLSYGEAIEMCKKGIDVTCVNWRAGEFLTVNNGSVVHADNFWSPGNKRMAMANPDQTLSVFPHFLRTTKYGTVPHMVDFNDQFSEWVVASDRIKVKTVSVDGNKVTLHYALDTFSTAEFELAPFWLAYDVLADLPNNVTVITDNDANVLVHLIASMKEAHDNQRRIVEESFEIYGDRIPEEFPNRRGVTHYRMSGLNNTIEAIRQGTFKHVIVDSDSFKTDFRLEAIKTALKEAKVNWASISVKEQLFGITE